MGALADQWDAIPSQDNQPTGKLSDQWDATPSETLKKAPIVGQKFTGGNLRDIGAIPIGIAETARGVVQGTAGQIAGGWRGLLTLAKGGSVADAAKAIQDTENAFAYQPKTAAGIIGQVGMASPQNPLNAPIIIGKKAGEITQNITGSPAAAAAVETAIAGAPLIYGAAKMLGRPSAPVEPDTAREALRAQWEGKTAQTAPESTPLVEAQAIPQAQSKPIEAQVVPPTFEETDIPSAKGADPLEYKQRADILSRVGLQNVRESALKGDALNAATDFQTTKYNEPAGQLAKEQFAAERSALTNYAQNIIEKTGGSFGTDEEALQTRGQNIAQPFDKLRDYFKQAKANLYNQAAERAQGAPIVNTSQVDTLLKDPDFTETLLAKDQGGLLTSIQRQFDRFKALNPEGMTVESSENFRKWLNQTWTPENSRTIGQVKGALDDSVFQSAGDDVYQAARRMHMLERSTLDDPKGISKILDTDPNTPINRVTPFNKLPDTLARLPPDQFAHIINTLKNMPPELQADAQAGLGEIKAHFANKILEIGDKTQTQWNAPGVTKYLKDNSLKLNQIFTPEEMQNISDLQRAGNILRVDPSYPGASAQAANALRRGLMARTIQSISTWTGGIIGGKPGAVIGEAAGAKMGGKAAEQSAVKQFSKRLVKLKDASKK